MTPTLSQAIAMAEGERLLTRDTHSHPEHVGSRGVDLLDDPVLVGAEIAASVSRDRKARIAFADVAYRAFHDAGFGAEKVEGRALDLGKPRDIVKQIRGRDALGKSNRAFQP